jgi:hypothetical protein
MAIADSPAARISLLVSFFSSVVDLFLLVNE